MRKQKAAAVILAVSVCIVLIGLAENDNRKAVARFERSYDRIKSRVMLRYIEKPTRAALDRAAYIDNVLLYSHVDSPPKPSQKRVSSSDLNLGGGIFGKGLVDRIADTPLSEEERRSPLAWFPLMDYLAEWNYDESIELLELGARVSATKLPGNRTGHPAQRIAAAYLHRAKDGSMEMWVEIEFEPWAATQVAVDDEDGDHFPEIYAKVPAKLFSKAVIERLNDDYMTRVLDSTEVEDYFYELSSDWYEKYNTDALDVSVNAIFPNENIEPEIREEMKGVTVIAPTAIIKGKPFGEPIYNVFVVAKFGADEGGSPEVSRTDKPTLSEIGEVTRSDNETNLRRWHIELDRWGNGDWNQWVESIAGFRTDVSDILKNNNGKGIVGRDGFLFFRGSLEYTIAGDLQKQENNPFPAIVDYKRKLAEKGIDMLFVVIPAKSEVYPDKLSDSMDEPIPYVTPYTRKFLWELTNAGVEVIDLLPAFIAARETSDEPIYMPLDTHWSPRGVKIAAQIIADRVKRSDWFPEVVSNPINYGVKEVEFVRAGDIRGMLPESERVKYRPMKLAAEQVIAPDGSPYEDDKSSPIVILGDSFCGVFHFEDCKHAGISAHVAKELGIAVDLIMAHGSGPRIRKTFARRGSAAISKKKVVIWTTAARDLYNYWAPWDFVPVP